MTEAVLVWNGLVSRVDEGLIVPSGPLADENCVHVVDAESEGVRNTFARDPWSGSHIEGSDNETGRRDRGVARRGHEGPGRRRVAQVLLARKAKPESLRE